MSWNVNFNVVDGKVDPDSLSGTAGLPDGNYNVGGHVYHGNDAHPMLSLTTPQGGVSCYLNDKSIQLPEVVEDATYHAE